MIKRDYEVHTTTMENKIHDDPTSFCKFVNSKRNDNFSTTIFTRGNDKLTEPKEIADAFANHFQSVFNNNVPFPTPLTDHSYQPITTRNITDKEVARAIQLMKPKRAIGRDGIPQYILSLIHISEPTRPY